MNIYDPISEALGLTPQNIPPLEEADINNTCRPQTYVERYGEDLALEIKAELRAINAEQFKDPRIRKKRLEALATTGDKIWINDGEKNKRVYEEIFTKEYSTWKRGRIMTNKFWEHENRNKCAKTGQFV